MLFTSTRYPVDYRAHAPGPWARRGSSRIWAKWHERYISSTGVAALLPFESRMTWTTRPRLCTPLITKSSQLADDYRARSRRYLKFLELGEAAHEGVRLWRQAALSRRVAVDLALAAFRKSLRSGPVHGTSRLSGQSPVAGALRRRDLPAFGADPDQRVADVLVIGEAALHDLRVSYAGSHPREIRLDCFIIRAAFPYMTRLSGNGF